MRLVARAVAILVSALAAAASATPAPPEDPARALRLEVAEWIRARAAWPVTRVEFPPLDAWAEVSNASDVELHLSTRPEQELLGEVPVFVIAQRGESVLRDGVLTVRVHADVPVAVAARDLRRGDVIGEGDVAIALRDLAELGTRFVASPEAAVGQRARRPLRAGEPLRPDELEPAPIVRRGQRLRLRLARGRLQIEAIGRAREDAAAGDWIRVQNLASRRELLARIDADGVAHVAY